MTLTTYDEDLCKKNEPNIYADLHTFEEKNVEEQLSFWDLEVQ